MREESIVGMDHGCKFKVSTLSEWAEENWGPTKGYSPTIEALEKIWFTFIMDST